MSRGRRVQAPQTGGFRQQEFNLPERWGLGPEAQGPAGPPPSPTPGRILPGLPQPRVACRSLAGGHITPASASAITWLSPPRVCLCVLSSQEDTGHTGQRTHPAPVGPRLTSYDQVLGVRLQGISVGDDTVHSQSAGSCPQSPPSASSWFLPIYIVTLQGPFPVWRPLHCSPPRSTHPMARAHPADSRGLHSPRASGQ